MKHLSNEQNDYAPIVILVRPQLAENMGMVARAMMNCGLSQLRIVNPRESHLSDKAISAASGAGSILEQAIVFDSLLDALADIQFSLATTARIREMVKPVFTPDFAQKELVQHIQAGQKCAVLFGPERTGLENDDLVMMDGLINIPLNPKHTSLNLSQAVLLIGYEWYKRMSVQEKHLETNGAFVATKEKLNHFLTHLEEILSQKGYFRFPDKEERMKRNLRDIFTRSTLTDSEIKTLYGVLDYLNK